jgi:protein-L-isoaspartate(D-aspartate) O-methyltransferase
MLREFNPPARGVMIDFERLRQSMVDSQIRPNDVTDPRILAAMLEVPRERFVPPQRAGLAYLDDDIVVSEASDGNPARYLVEPMILARLIQALNLTAQDHVLDVGCTTGYSSAILSHLAGSVCGLESDSELAAAAQRNVPNARIVTGPLTGGTVQAGPFDAILVNGSVEVVPESLLSQLKEGGRLVAVVRKGPPGRATIYALHNGAVSARPLFNAAVPPLPGFEAPRGFVF